MGLGRRHFPHGLLGTGFKPWNQLLRFWDPATEAAYWDSRVAHVLWIYDFVLHLLGSVSGTVVFLGLAPTASSPVVTVLLPIWVALGALGAGLSYSRSGLYKACRGGMIAVRRLMMVPIASVVSTLLGPPSATPGAVVARLLFSSSVTPLVTMSLGMQLRFRHHVALQFLCTALASAFTPMYCASCLSDDAFGPVFRSMGSAIDSTAQTLVWLKSGREGLDGRYSCWLVVTFSQWWVGFLLCSAVVYLVEFWSRANHVLTMKCASGGDPKGTSRDVGLWTVGRDALLLTCWVFVVSSITLWAVLRDAAWGATP